MADKKTTVAEQIWEKIREKEINMFALPAQKIENYCVPVLVEPSKLYLTLTSNATSVLPALEAVLGNNYTVELAGKYIVIANAVTP